MTSKATALLRWLGIAGLWALIALLAVPTLPAHWLAALGLSLIEALASAANRLRTPR
jgi:hypothetical protein